MLLKTGVNDVVFSQIALFIIFPTNSISPFVCCTAMTPLFVSNLASN